jgi:hypothetical protein
MRVQLGGHNQRVRIAFGQNGGLAPGSAAAIKDSRSAPNQGGNQLRAFILNGDPMLLESGATSDITAFHDSGVGEQGAGREAYSGVAQLLLGGRSYQTKRCRRRLLVVGANACGGFDTELSDPAGDKPAGMSESLG